MKNSLNNRKGNVFTYIKNFTDKIDTDIVVRPHNLVYVLLNLLYVD